MREKTLGEFLDAEGGGKVGQWHGKKAEQVLEGQAVRLEGEDFGTDGDLVGDFSVMMVTVVKEKHAVVALEVVEDDDDVPIVSLGPWLLPLLVEELGGAVGSVKGHFFVIFVRLSAEEDGRLHSLLVHGGFVIGIDLERRISVYHHMTIGITRQGFAKGTAVDLVVIDPLGFGLVFFGDALDKAFVTRQHDLFAANAALALSAHVLWSTMIATATHFIA